MTTVISSKDLTTSGNAISITVAGQNRTLTVPYATSAGTADSVAWGNVTGKPTTLAGYGITDFKVGINQKVDADNVLYNYIGYYGSNGPTEAVGSDNAIYAQAYSPEWVAQIAQSYRDGRIFVRGKNNGTWTNWLKIIDSGNIGSQSVNYATSAGSASSATTATNLTSAPSLGISGNTITVTAGGKTSSAITVPYATNAGSASSATTAGSCSGNAATATTATNLASAPSLGISGNTITVTAGGKTSGAITVPYATNAGTASSCSGNAATATSATTATNLASAPSLGISGNTITVTAGGKTSSAITVPYATSAGNASTVGSISANNFVYSFANVDCAPATNDGNYFGMTTSSGISTDWWNIISLNWGVGKTVSNKTWASQLALPTQSRTGMYYRAGSGSSAYGNWIKLIDSTTIGSQSVNYATSAGTATTATTANSVAWGNVSGKPTTLAGYGITDFKAGTNSGTNANDVTYNYLGYYTSNGPATSIGATATDGSLIVQAYSSSWVTQIAQDYRNGNLFVRGKNNGSWTTWKSVMTALTYTATTSGAISLNGKDYNSAVITLNGNASSVALSAYPHPGKDFHVIFYSTAARTVTIAHNATSSVLPAGSGSVTLNVPANGYCEINFFYDGTRCYVRGV